MTPTKGNRSACSRDHSRAVDRARPFAPRPLATSAVALLVVPPGHVHPPVRVDGLAQDHDVAGIPEFRSRWDADRHRDVGGVRTARLPVGPRVRVAVSAARRRVPGLVGERPQVGWQCLAELEPGVWAHLTEGGTK